MSPSEALDLQVVFDDESSVETLQAKIHVRSSKANPCAEIVAHAEDSDDDKKSDFEEVPVSIVRNLEKYDFAGPENVHGLETTNIPISSNDFSL